MSFSSVIIVSIVMNRKNGRVNSTPAMTVLTKMTAQKQIFKNMN